MTSSKSIPTRRLGRNGPYVPALGYGLMGLSHGNYGAIPSDDEVFAIVGHYRPFFHAARRWLRLINMGSLYGANESLIGQWFKRTGKRNEIFLATKFGSVKGGKGHEVDSSYEYCKRACAESLRLLDIDYIDLYYLHSANPQTPIEETMRALSELQAEGKIHHIGLSAISGATLRRAVKIAPVATVQTDYSPFELSIEGADSKNLLAACRELGVAVVAAMPLGRGMITTTFASGGAVSDSQDMRPLAMYRFMDVNRSVNVMAVQQFKTFADRKGCSTAQLALAWLLKQGKDIIPIPGTKKMKYLEENWAALDTVLSDEEALVIRRFLETAEIAGETLPAAFKGCAFKDTVEEA